MKYNKHKLWMIIGCVLPLLFIFLAPSLGIKNNISIFIFISVMFVFHLLMPHDHGGNHHEQNNKGIQSNDKTLNIKNHENH